MAGNKWRETNYLMYQSFVVVSSAAASLLCVSRTRTNHRFYGCNDVSELDVGDELVDLRPRENDAHEHLIQLVPEHYFPRLRVCKNALEIAQASACVLRCPLLGSLPAQQGLAAQLQQVLLGPASKHVPKLERQAVAGLQRWSGFGIRGPSQVLRHDVAVMKGLVLALNGAAAAVSRCNVLPSRGIQTSKNVGIGPCVPV
jgi:hypothetical protein